MFLWLLPDNARGSDSSTHLTHTRGNFIDREHRAVRRRINGRGRGSRTQIERPFESEVTASTWIAALPFEHNSESTSRTLRFSRAPSPRPFAFFGPG